MIRDPGWIGESGDPWEDEPSYTVTDCTMCYAMGRKAEMVWVESWREYVHDEKECLKDGFQQLDDEFVTVKRHLEAQIRLLQEENSKLSEEYARVYQENLQLVKVNETLTSDRDNWRRLYENAGDAL